MNKKILDVTVAFTFCICLIVTTKIEEKDNAQYIREEIAVTEEKEAVTAGVCNVLSEYSFTTESDEETGIAKKEVIVVTTPSGEETITENDREDENEALEEETYQNRWNISLTAEEIDLLAKIVWLESRGEPQEGQEAIVEVIFNRMVSDKYPDTLYDVLSQKNPVQFCSWKNRESAKPTEKEYQSIANVLNGNTNILRNDTLYFSTEPLTSRLDVMIGGHSFCY
ncbi:MAG: cell wall hydrolase [Clostridiales bacterium]|nr:cell wall hydrolase [Roseburia sp.]MDD7635863.1 cell wall hydrolase [Clostridiales bacterium]MDY4113596.1 cell wall hydrolase [Roseburia sp.]